MPAVSTVHEILRRNGRIVAPGGGPEALQRFEKPSPNLLWQMDFKGHIALSAGGRCHPLTIIDDHSRYAVGLEACANEQRRTVQQRLELTFRRYGLPDAFFVDYAVGKHFSVQTQIFVVFQFAQCCIGYGTNSHLQCTSVFNK